MFHYFKIPYFTCTFFSKFIYNEYIGPHFLSHVVLKFSPVISPSIHQNITRNGSYGAVSTTSLFQIEERIAFNFQQSNVYPCHNCSTLIPKREAHGQSWWSDGEGPGLSWKFWLDHFTTCRIITSLSLIPASEYIFTQTLAAMDIPARILLSLLEYIPGANP
jgi:hypothetical protein